MALGVRIPTVALHLTELFDTTVEQLYSIFTVKDVSKALSYSTIHCKEKNRVFLKEGLQGNLKGRWPLVVDCISSWGNLCFPKEESFDVQQNSNKPHCC